MLLIFVGAVADFAEPMKEDGPCQAVARLALVEFAARPGPLEPQPLPFEPAL